MVWTLIQNTSGHKIWRATEYADLQYAEINNLAQYGQPRNPDQDGFDPNFVPDFQNVIIQIPHQAIMYHGHGKNIGPTHFPIITQFLNGAIGVPDGTYSFSQLQAHNPISRLRRTISGNLYGTSSLPITSGTISASDAAYIYGSVGYALMRTTRYAKRGNTYTVQGAIGALDDNWDFQSSHPIAKTLNPLIAALLGPDHYKLEPNPDVPSDTMGRIEIEYIGPGKPFSIQNIAYP